MISDRVAFSVVVVVNVLGRLDVPLRHEAAAEVQPAATGFGDRPGYVRLNPPRPHEVAHLMPAGVEELGDQAAVALRPRGLGAHHGGSRLAEDALEGGLPALGADPGGVRAEGRHPDAVEAR